jgi:mannose-6-phosphate isomerase-like protein (cupin superfamily)
LKGSLGWHFRARGDELFLIHRGRLLIKFRDREEIIEEGDFIVVPPGVEHCPIALGNACEVLLLEPASN